MFASQSGSCAASHARKPSSVAGGGAYLIQDQRSLHLEKDPVLGKLCIGKTPPARQQLSLKGDDLCEGPRGELRQM